MDDGIVLMMVFVVDDYDDKYDVSIVQMQE